MRSVGTLVTAGRIRGEHAPVFSGRTPLADGAGADAQRIRVGHWSQNVVDTPVLVAHIAADMVGCCAVA